MRRKRRTFTSEFKLKVILEALKERETLAEISQKNKARLSEIIDRTISAFEQIEH